MKNHNKKDMKITLESQMATITNEKRKNHKEKVMKITLRSQVTIRYWTNSLKTKIRRTNVPHPSKSKQDTIYCEYKFTF